ncbi:hypothetical protein [Clavibacter zhangzhiyongii]|uniref:hypothetical protein n=1 Tax=Clavibacter zhangzhiyongii TaxID=2768071 RepID=UPI0039DF847A
MPVSVAPTAAVIAPAVPVSAAQPAAPRPGDPACVAFSPTGDVPPRGHVDPRGRPRPRARRGRAARRLTGDPPPPP